MASPGLSPLAPWDAAELDGDALLAQLLDDTAEEADALLADLLPQSPVQALVAISDAPTVVIQPLDATNKLRENARQSEKPAPAKRASREKHKLEDLRHEVRQLTQELKRLRSQGNTRSSHSSAIEAAAAERHKRRRAEVECRQLRAAVYAHARFIRSLRSVFSGLPPPCEGLNLSQYLHDYVRLPRDKSSRRSEYEALSRDERLSMAVEILCRETQSISFDTPHIQTEFLPASDGFAMTTLSVYAVNTQDVSAVLRGACVAVRDIVATWPQCEPVDVTRRIVDADEAVAVDHHLLYRLVSAKHKHKESGDELSIQARATTFYRLTEDDAIMMWDFVDEDELYPIATEAADLTRQSIGALLMRRERCRDGVERIVCRSICTKRYTSHSSRSSKVLKRFIDAARESSRPNGRVFYEIVTQQVAEEQAVVAKHLTTKGIVC